MRAEKEDVVVIESPKAPRKRKSGSQASIEGTC